MREKVYPHVEEEEAKQMYTEFHTIVSSFARQSSESMLAWTQRRRRCYDLLKELDSQRANVSDEILGDMMLDNAGLSRTEKLLILTSTGNSKSFGDIGDALKKQHPRIHLHEVPRKFFWS